MNVEIITIGDEILIGQIVDTNSAWIAKQLNLLGIELVQISSVSDKKGAIQESLRLAAMRADVILCTGGLGPTKDDVTRQALAEFFNVGLYRHPGVLAHVENIFKRFNRPMLEANRKQADILENAEVLHNETGTAPGMWIPHEGKIYVVMPGVPTEMRYLMEKEVLPRLESMPGRQGIVHQSLLTAGIGESFLADQLKTIEEDLPSHIHLAYLPKFGQVRLRLSAFGPDKAALEQEVTCFLQRIADQVCPYVVAFGEEPLEQIILSLLTQSSVTLSTAESCTGGYLAHQFTAIPGSSAAFLGGAITYSNTLKTKMLGVKEETLISFGAVSEETAQEMALGAQREYHTDYAVATTGIAGPDGGTVEKPVGTVWIAVAGKTKVVAKKFNFGKLRTPNIERATANALVMLFQLMKEELGV